MSKTLDEIRKGLLSWNHFNHQFNDRVLDETYRAICQLESALASAQAEAAKLREFMKEFRRAMDNIAHIEHILYPGPTLHELREKAVELLKDTK